MDGLGGGEDLSAMVSTAQSGDEAAFRRMYRLLQPTLIRYLRALVGADADDVASETWLHIARDLDSFHGDWGSFRGWAATVARHRAMDHLRHQRRRPTVTMPAEDLHGLAGGDDTAATAIEEVGTDEAIALVATLPPDQAEAILLRVVVGLDATTTGRILGKSAGAVRTAAYRGLRQLANALAPLTPRPGEQPVTIPQRVALKEMR